MKVSLTNILYIPDIRVNLLSINKLLDINIVITFQKINYFLIKSDLKLTNIRNRDFFFLNL